MKKLHAITVKGRHKTWSFHCYLDPQYLSEWREDGLEIDPIENIIPECVVYMGLTRPWCFVQDLWNGKFLRKWGW